MTTVDSDNFTRTVSSGWGTSSGGSTWADDGGAFTSSVNGTNGLANETGTGFTGYKLISGASQQNPTVSGDCKSAGANSKIGVMACYLSASVNYDVNFGGSGQCIIERNGVTVASGFTIASFVVTNVYTVELLVNNGTIEARFWQAGGTRPTSPNLTYSDSSPLAAGSYGFIFISSATGARTWTVDNFLATVVGGVSLATTFAGVGTVTASLSAQTSLALTAAGVGTLAGTLHYATHLSTTFAGVGTVTASFRFARALVLQVNGVGTVTATLHAATFLTCTVIGTSHVLLTLTTIVHLSATFMGRAQVHLTLTLSSISLHVTFVGSSSVSLSFGGVIPEVQGNRLVFAKARKHHVG